MSADEPIKVAEEMTLDDLRAAVVELFGADRRVRGRDQQSRDLTQSQLQALYALGQSEAVTAGQLARSADLNPASVTAMLDNLQEKGVVERHRDPHDRRVCMVSLTEAGRAIVAERKERWLALWEEDFGDLSQRELAVGVRVIRTLTDLLDKL